MKRYILPGIWAHNPMRDIAMMLMTALLLSLASCTDDIVENAGSKDVDPFEGEMICFAAGTTENEVGSLNSSLFHLSCLICNFLEFCKCNLCI